ncbi:MAG: D-lyxose/D-mannose family sugar isomerase [Fibrobacteria bacterium]|nr:D-lyxose/D-mannose family sugar isomerase [Fibrobacteria bacterium]
MTVATTKTHDALKLQKAKEEALIIYHELLKKSGIAITDEDRKTLFSVDLGGTHFPDEGLGSIDLLRTSRVRVSIILLLPGQTLPEHLHPSYEGEPGKEETVRVLYGKTMLYVEGKPSDNVILPKGKEQWYTAMHRNTLLPGDQYTVQPKIKHWFQAGPEGSVNMIFQNKVDETRNLFFDPDLKGCQVPSGLKFQSGAF